MNELNKIEKELIKLTKSDNKEERYVLMLEIQRKLNIIRNDLNAKMLSKTE